MGLRAQNQTPEIVPDINLESTRNIFLGGPAGNYLVTVSHGTKKRTEKWDATHPFGLNFPPTLFLKKTGPQINIVHLFSEDGVKKEERFVSIPEPATPGRVGEWSEIGIVNGAPLRIKISRVLRSRAAYLPMISVLAGPRQVAETLYVSCGVHGFLSAFECLDQKGTFAGQIENFRVFILIRTAKGAYIKARDSGVVIKLKGKLPTTLQKNVKTALSASDLQSLKVLVGDYWWRFNRLAVPVFTHLDVVDTQLEETSVFRQYAWSIGGVLAVALGLAFLAPKHEVAKIDILKEATHIELKRPKLLPPVPKPVAIVVPPPKPKFIPPPKPKVIPPPKRIVTPKPAPKAKLVEKKPGPRKPPPKPKFVQHPAKVSAPKVVSQRPAPTRPAAVAPNPTQVAKVPPPAAQKPSGPTPEQLKQAKDTQARADLAKSLGFLTTTPSKSAPVQLSAGSGSKDAKYAKLEKNSIAGAGSPSALSKMAKNVGSAAGGTIQTTSSRSIASVSGITGRSKGLNEVQGKVSLAALYGTGGGGAGSSIAGGMSVSGAGSLADSSILKTLSKYLNKFQYCYEKSLLSNALAAGTLTMEWTIGGGGVTSGAKVVRSELNDEKLHSCMKTELLKIHFQPPSGGSVVVKYPFTFSSSSL